MAIMNCATCGLWSKSQKGETGWRMGMGTCMNVPNFFDVTETVSESDPEDSETGSRNLKPESIELKALCLDGSGYKAELITAPDFGCVNFV